MLQPRTTCSNEYWISGYLVLQRLFLLGTANAPSQDSAAVPEIIAKRELLSLGIEGDVESLN